MVCIEAHIHTHTHTHMGKSLVQEGIQLHAIDNFIHRIPDCSQLFPLVSMKEESCSYWSAVRKEGRKEGTKEGNELDPTPQGRLPKLQRATDSTL